MELTKYEQSNQRAPDKDQCWSQSRLLRTETVLEDIRYEHELEVVEVYAHCEDTAHNNACENDTCLSNIKAIQRAVYLGEHFEERIVDAVNESRVDIGEQYGRILKHYLEWLNESVESYCISRQAPTVDLALRAYIWILAEFAEAHRPTKENVAS